MLILVFAIKGALVPLHFWLPATYANAPGVVAALFAIMTKVGAYATLRFGTLVFPPDLPATGLILPTLLLPAALVTLAIGAIGTLGATTLPRLAAFAGIASMGTVFLALAQHHAHRHCRGALLPPPLHPRDRPDLPRDRPCVATPHDA